jgi:hypothetical protein
VLFLLIRLLSSSLVLYSRFALFKISFEDILMALQNTQASFLDEAAMDDFYRFKDEFL